jgi:hypothetical protein
MTSPDTPATVNVAATLAKLDKSKSPLSKEAAAVIRAIEAALLETEKERDEVAAIVNAMSLGKPTGERPPNPTPVSDITVSGGLVPPTTDFPPAPPPITPTVAFDIMSERANCARIAMQALPSGWIYSDQWDAKNKTELVHMARARAADDILAQPKPVIRAKG